METRIGIEPFLVLSQRSAWPLRQTGLSVPLATHPPPPTLFWLSISGKKSRTLHFQPFLGRVNCHQSHRNHVAIRKGRLLTIWRSQIPFALCPARAVCHEHACARFGESDAKFPCDVIIFITRSNGRFGNWSQPAVFVVCSNWLFHQLFFLTFLSDVWLPTRNANRDSIIHRWHRLFVCRF